MLVRQVQLPNLKKTNTICSALLCRRAWYKRKENSTSSYTTPLVKAVQNEGFLFSSSLSHSSWYFCNQIFLNALPGVGKLSRGEHAGLWRVSSSASDSLS